MQDACFGLMISSSAASLREITFDNGSSPQLFSEETPSPFAEWIQNGYAGFPENSPRLFLVLQRLTLRGVTLTKGVADVVRVFGIPYLQSLKLEDREGTNELLEMLANPSQPMQLKSFELKVTGSDADRSDPRPLMTFLRSFRGLEDLFIMYTEEWSGASEYRHAINHHSSTLRRLVHQPSSIDEDWFKAYDSDAEDGTLEDKMSNGLIESLPKLKRLQYLGICNQADHIVSHESGLPTVQPL